MAQVYLWLVAGVVLGSIPAASLGEDVLWIHSLDNWRILHLLRQLQRIPPQLCLNDRIDFQYPWQRGTVTQMQKTQRTCVHHLMLQQIFNLLLTEPSAAAWNKTLLDQLCRALHRQLEALDTCVVREMGEQASALAMQGPTLALKRYFQGIRLYLQEKKYSDCAWEVVRVEVMRAFSSTRLLHERLRKKERDLRSP